MSQPEDDKLNFPDFELPGEHSPPPGDMPTTDFTGPPAETEGASEIVPGGQSPAEEPLGGLGGLGAVPSESAEEPLGGLGEPGAVPSEPAEEPLAGLGEPGVAPLEPAAEGEPSAAGEPGEFPEFGGEELGGVAKLSKKKKKKGKISKMGDSEEGEEKGDSIWRRMAKASPYTMMLWISLLAMIAGSVFLYLELRSYKFDLKAREAKQRVGAVAAAHSGPARTNAVA